MIERPGFSAALGNGGAVRALAEGRIVPSAFRMEVSSFTSLPPAFRRMVRGLEFDMCEMAISTYVCARARGVPITALPVFPMRGFHHGAIFVRRDAGIAAPKDLEGRSVGLDRGYTVTTGVWARGILSAHYGVDLARIDWVMAGDEHVADYRPPACVRRIADGATIRELLLRGDVAAAIGIDPAHPDIVPLIPNHQEIALGRFCTHDHYPINHLIVVRDTLLAERPEMALDLVNAFHEAKLLYLADLRAGAIREPDAADRRNETLLQIVTDPLPYGVPQNHAMLKELIRHAADQRIIDRIVPVESLFAPTTRAWGS